MSAECGVATDQKIVAMFVDAVGLPRAYAIGPERLKDEVVERARAHLARRCARLGEDERDYRFVVEPHVPAPRTEWVQND